MEPPSELKLGASSGFSGASSESRDEDTQLCPQCFPYFPYATDLLSFTSSFLSPPRPLS